MVRRRRPAAVGDDDLASALEPGDLGHQRADGTATGDQHVLPGDAPARRTAWTAVASGSVMAASSRLVVGRMRTSCAAETTKRLAAGPSRLPPMKSRSAALGHEADPAARAGAAADGRLDGRRCRRAPGRPRRARPRARVPLTSWPWTSGGWTMGCSPLKTWTSEPQMPMRSRLDEHLAGAGLGDLDVAVLDPAHLGHIGLPHGLPHRHPLLARVTGLVIVPGHPSSHQLAGAGCVHGLRRHHGGAEGGAFRLVDRGHGPAVGRHPQLPPQRHARGMAGGEDQLVGAAAGGLQLVDDGSRASGQPLEDGAHQRPAAGVVGHLVERARAQIVGQLEGDAVGSLQAQRRPRRTWPRRRSRRRAGGATA